MVVKQKNINKPNNIEFIEDNEIIKPEPITTEGSEQTNDFDPTEFYFDIPDLEIMDIPDLEISDIPNLDFNPLEIDFDYECTESDYVDYDIETE